MLRSSKELESHPIKAVDGNIGKVKDFLFDDEMWGLRYLVADTGGWLKSRKVLISPCNIVTPDQTADWKTVFVNLTKSQVENSPRIDHDATISRQLEVEFARYYGYPPYWTGPFLWGETSFSPADRLPRSPTEVEEHRVKLTEISETHLRSVDEVTGYLIEGSDGEIGHVEDLIVEACEWQFQYLIVDTQNWLPGKKVMLDIDWIEELDWHTQTAKLNLTTHQIETAPGFDPTIPINRNYLDQLYDFYGRPY